MEFEEYLRASGEALGGAVTEEAERLCITALQLVMVDSGDPYNEALCLQALGDVWLYRAKHTGSNLYRN